MRHHKTSGPAKWIAYHLYIVIDVFRRYVAAWRLEPRESGLLAEEMFAQTFAREVIDPKGIIVHADGGPAMTSKTINQLFSDLGVQPTRSRPHCSNDNPFIEACNKTLKYGPTFPERFANVEQGSDVYRHFFPWDNGEQ